MEQTWESSVVVLYYFRENNLVFLNHGCKNQNCNQYYVIVQDKVTDWKGFKSAGLITESRVFARSSDFYFIFYCALHHSDQTSIENSFKSIDLMIQGWWGYQIIYFQSDSKLSNQMKFWTLHDDFNQSWLSDMLKRNCKIWELDKVCQ